MKNLSQYLAGEHLTKFVWNTDSFSSKENKTTFDKAKENLKTSIESQLKNLGHLVNKDAVMEDFEEDNGNEEVITVNYGTGRTVLKEKIKGSNNDEKIIVKNGKLKIKRGWLKKADLKLKDKTGDNDFLDQEDVIKFGHDERYKVLEVTPETDASKEFKKNIEKLDGNIEGMLEDDLVSLEGKINDLCLKIEDTNNGLTDKERTDLLGRLNSLTARIATRREALNPKNNVEGGNETMKGYEAKILGLESRLSGANKEKLAALKLEGQALKTEINNIAEDKLSVEEKKTLTDRIDSLIKNIETKKNDLDSAEKREAAEQSLKDAQKLIDAIDLTDLGIGNCQTFKTPIETARQAIGKADDLTKEIFPDLAEKIPGLEAQLDKKENQVELYKTGADKQKKVTDEYQKQTDERLNEIDADITAKVKEHTDKLKELAKTTSNPKELPVSALTINSAENPNSYEQIQKGMQAHRLDSMMMLEEVNFLQTCGSKFAEEIAEFEEEKSKFSLPNIGRFVASSIAILPGAAWDLGEWAIGTGKRAGDRFGWLGFGDSRAEELQKKQGTFEKEFTAKQEEIKTKKSTLDKYGKTLQDNSESLKTTAPAKVKTDIEKSIADQLSEKGLDVSQEPWKGIQEKLTAEFKKTATEKVQPAVDQLDMMVNGSVPELTGASDFALNAASQTSKYIKDLDIHSATVLDMSVGFLTKNIAKGFDGVGDVLAMNPVTGVLGGLCRAAGGLVEGVGTLVTDPDKVAAGLGGLFGYEYGNGFSLSRAGDAWSGLVTGFLGVEAFKTGFAKLKKGGFLNVIHGLGEITAGVGEGGGNIIATVFTGGTVAGVRSGGILGKLGTVGSKIARTGVAKVAKYMPESIVNGTSGVGRVGTKLGKFAAKGGDLALSSLRLGLRPLRALKAGRVLERGLTPTRWVKNGNMKYLRNQKARYLKSSRRMERLADKTKNGPLKKSYLKEAKNISDKANKINAKPVVTSKVKMSALENNLTKAEKALKKSDDAIKKSAELGKNMEKAKAVVLDAEAKLASAGKRSLRNKLNPKNKSPQSTLKTAQREVAKIEKDMLKNKKLVGDRVVLQGNVSKAKMILEKAKGKTVVAPKKKIDIDGVNARINLKGDFAKARAAAEQSIKKLEVENLQFSRAMESHAKNIEKGKSYIATEVAAGRKPTSVRNVNKKLETRYNELKNKHAQNTKNIDFQRNIINEANFHIKEINMSRTKIKQNLNQYESASSKLNIPKASTRGSILGGLAVGAAIPASYATAEMEKAKIENIKEKIPKKSKFESTPLVELDGSPSPVNGTPAAGRSSEIK